MTIKEWTGAAPIATVACMVLLFLAPACGQPGSSANLPAPFAGTSPPRGGPLPAQLLGDWYLPSAIVIAEEGNSSCHVLKLTLSTTKYRITHDPACGGLTSSGDVVVNNTEIDFFNADVCGLKLPDGVGRYTWTVSSGVLHFAPLSQDPCPRGKSWLANRDYSRTAT